MDLESGRTSLAYDNNTLDGSLSYSELVSEKIKLLGAKEEPAGPDYAKTAPKSGKSRAFHYLSVLLFVLSLVLAVPIVYLVLPKIFNEATVGRAIDDCGPSVGEAIAKGCIFDNTSYAWVQPPCHDEELPVAYRKQPGIPYYFD